MPRVNCRFGLLGCALVGLSVLASYQLARAPDSVDDALKHSRPKTPNPRARVRGQVRQLKVTKKGRAKNPSVPRDSANRTHGYAKQLERFRALVLAADYDEVARLRVRIKKLAEESTANLQFLLHTYATARPMKYKKTILWVVSEIKKRRVYDFLLTEFFNLERPVGLRTIALTQMQAHIRRGNTAYIDNVSLRLRLVKVAHNPDEAPGVRAGALSVIGWTDLGKNEQIRGAVQEILHRGGPPELISTALALASRWPGDREFVADARRIASASESNHIARDEAISYLVQSRTTAALATVFDILRTNSNPSVRTVVASRLSTLADDKKVRLELVHTVLSDANSSVQLAAIKALARGLNDDNHVRKSLRTVVRGTRFSSKVRSAAASTLLTLSEMNSTRDRSLTIRYLKESLLLDPSLKLSKELRQRLR